MLGIHKHYPKTLAKALQGEMLKVDPLLQCTTSNGCITFCASDMAPSTPTIIVKVQIKTSTSTDDIMFDIINGSILNTFAKDNLLCHFTRLEGFGRVRVAYRDSKPYRLVEDSKHVDDKVRLRHFCATRFVSGARALTDMFRTKLSNKQQLALYASVRDLLSALYHMGNEIGMTHNDLHTNNVLYDPYQKCLVVIDYGRMLFDGDALRNCCDIWDIVRHSRKSSWAQGNYSEMTRHVLKHHRCRMIDLYSIKDSWFVRNLFMFDAMALSLDIIFNFKNQRDRRLTKLTKVFTLDEHWSVGRKNGQVKLKQLYYTVLDPDSWTTASTPKQDLQLTIGPGVFWFALTLKYLYECDAEKYGIQRHKKTERAWWYTADMLHLARRKINIMHPFGTLISLPDPKHYRAFLIPYKDKVEHIKKWFSAAVIDPSPKSFM